MVGASAAQSTVEQKELLETARTGSEDAYRRLVEPHRSELQAHCYRMLGSVQDAEDALQEALVRAWKALPKFEGRSSLRSWLYRIATNTSLDAIERRPKRVLPVDYGPPADPEGGVGDRVGGGIVEDGAKSPLWVPYVAVPDVGQATERAERLGGEVLIGPREGPHGWRSVITAPDGGDLAFWQPKRS